MNGREVHPIVLADSLILPPEAVTEGFAILANRGAGKSATATLFVEQLYKAGSPVVVVDVKGDWWGIRSGADGRTPGLPLVIFGGEHADVDLEPTAGSLVADLVVDDQVSAVLDLSDMSKTKARAFATDFAERLYRRNRDPLHVVVEEADVLIPQRGTAAEARLLGAWEDIAKRGRHRGLGITVVSQRPQEVSKSVLDLMETVILLRMTGPRSIKAVQDWIGVNASAEDTEVAAVIKSLPELATGEGWVWSPAFLRTLQRVRFPLFSTFDSHATPVPGRRRVLPKTRADIDLDRIRAEIAATAAAPSAPADTKGLRAENTRLREQVARHTALLARKDSEIDELRERLARPVLPEGLADALRTAHEQIQRARHMIEPSARTQPADGRSVPSPEVTPTSARQPQAPSPADRSATAATRPRFRSGAERMLSTLGRMAPLRLTKTQWGTVAHMSHTSGTFSTYLSDLRRAGLIDENAAGFTLTPAGFDYLGRVPEPMTAAELQDHYLTILRSGAARMLREIIAVYPRGLTRDELADRADLSVASGTFSTYLSDLRRNGLVDNGTSGMITATAVLMNGASSPERLVE